MANKRVWDNPRFWIIGTLLPLISLILAITFTVFRGYNDPVYRQVATTFALFAFGSLTGAFLIFFAKRYLTKGKKLIWDKLFFLHEPNEAIGNIGKYHFIKNPIALYALSLFFFFCISWFFAISGQHFFAATESFAQSSIPDTTDIAFNSIVPPIAENFTAGWALGFTLVFTILFSLFIVWIFRKIFKISTKTSLDISKTTYFLLAMLIAAPLFGIVEWGNYHNIAYPQGGIERAWTNFFGTFGAETVITTGSAIPWFSFHQTNNYFNKLYQLGYLDNPFIKAGNILFLLWLIFIMMATYKYKPFRDVGNYFTKS